MATFAPAQLAQGAARQPLPFGLFSVLNLPTLEDSHWQAGGVRWDPEAVGTIGGVGHPTGANEEGVPDTDPPGSPSSGVPKSFGSSNDQGLALPFSVYGAWKVTPVAYNQKTAEEEALATLLAWEEQYAEYYLWTGAADNVPNLTDDIVPLGSGSGGAIIGDLEEHIANSYASLGVIHMARSEALKLLGDQVLEVKGSLLKTKLGTPVVAGSGYPSGFARATPAMFGFRSEVFYSSQQGNPLMDVKNNDLYAIAERTYLIGFDPTGVGSVILS